VARVTFRLARSCTRMRWLALGRRVAAKCRVGVAAQRTLRYRKITPYPQAQTTGISVALQPPEINDRRTLSSQHTASPSMLQERERSQASASTIRVNLQVRSLRGRLWRPARPPSLRATTRKPSRLILCTWSADWAGRSRATGAWSTIRAPMRGARQRMGPFQRGRWEQYAREMIRRRRRLAVLNATANSQ
jgi:hypothetical protein